ncbi:hypothetical protein FOQG_03014 [Fusarium oxysporum f. sp. raphani 54005]|jgi:hypothetical protein|uniref:Uncharacterized protein n=3 Tax=Fusarium oxysporum TaxID=5507 RepID=X0CNH8_FUSOX|nr:hypothetical protein FOVG_00721 [Fusarium oxysporum f. sp. pisi HDV247]EXK95686.1 hypothetical protein FOQG_03014 [Fusarium oxysporum f. sp. raphani 54005]EXL86818.1 hypothetical protein FOPG_01772 [Fusarium oxysporum f. sp. conglutinans race 2 54008]KAJ4058577.1 hypothetical protein NW763_005999 [Fusarium oxysporum]KAJ4059955.1 hypothetical protein NW758_000514 [Fusarium oxysporum]
MHKVKNLGNVTGGLQQDGSRDEKAIETMACLHSMRPSRMEDIMNTGGGDALVLDERGAERPKSSSSLRIDMIKTEEGERKSTGPCRSQKVRVPAKFGGLLWATVHVWVEARRAFVGAFEAASWGCYAVHPRDHSSVSWGDDDEVVRVASPSRNS